MQANTRILVVVFSVILITIGLSGTAYPSSSQKHQWLASWYGPKFHGNAMANGHTFNMHDPTVVAHKTLPFGTRLKLTNPENGRSIIAVVQDRGPYHGNRSLDLSRAGAAQLGFLNTGTAVLIVTII